MIFFCITLWRNAIVVTSVIVKELWKILLVLKTKTFCDLEEWTSFICLKVKYFRKKEKKCILSPLTMGGEEGVQKGCFRSLPQMLCNLQPFLVRFYYKNQFFSDKFWPPHYLKFYWYCYCIISFLFYWTEYGHVIFAKKQKKLTYNSYSVHNMGRGIDLREWIGLLLQQP